MPSPAAPAAEPASAQAPAPTWQHITYPAVAIPGTTGEQMTFAVSSDVNYVFSSDGSGPRPIGEPSHLRLDLQWSYMHQPGPNGGRTLPPSIADAKTIVVKLHTAEGRTFTSEDPPSWVGVVWSSKVTMSLISSFPWMRNAFDEAWFEVRAGGQTWWVELPYGFTRNPADPEVPAPAGDVPRFPPTMQVGSSDILVPWMDVDYDLGRISIIDQSQDLTLRLANGGIPRAFVTLERLPVGGGSTRQSLDTPRVAMSIDLPGRSVTGREIRRGLDHDYYQSTRTNEFVFDDRSGRSSGRTFGTVTVAIEDQRYSVRVPSSLLVRDHGRTDPANRQRMKEPR